MTEASAIIDYLREAAPRARAALCDKPNHGAWLAVHDAERLVKGLPLEARAEQRDSWWVDDPVTGYLDPMTVIRTITKIVRRYAG